jgi:endonuclease/exonuclease/phosphatase family metal-dependent hydrolase
MMAISAAGCGLGAQALALDVGAGRTYADAMPLAPPAAPPDVADPPAEVDAMLARLANALDGEGGVPRRRPDSLLIATWNIRAFGGLTEKWRAAADDSPMRNLADVCAIAEIVSRFDVVALQETRENLRALRAMMARLGEHWAFIITDVGIGKPANGERLAFVYDRGRVSASGLAGELVVPADGLEGHGRAKLKKQFARSPYAVSFAVGSQAFTLVTLHVLYGSNARERTGELGAIGRWLADRAKSGTDFNHNMIALGDFNIDGLHDPNYAAFTAQGLRPPAALADQPRTIYDTPRKKHFYDQIAWFTEAGRRQLTLGYAGRAGRFDWTSCLHVGMDNDARSWRISDHYPLWCEFELSADNTDAASMPGRRRRRFR